MSTNIQTQITNMQSWTNIMKGEQLEQNGASTDLDQDAFLMLMMEQLKYQDPLEPVGNTEFLAQQAAFTQVSELQQLNSSISSMTEAMNTNNQVIQACTLIGQNVTLLNPEDTTQTISGKVTEVTFTSGAAQIVVDGKEYPLGLVMGISQDSVANTGSTEDTANKS